MSVLRHIHVCAAALLLASCSDETPWDGAAESLALSREICFAASDGSATRGTPISAITDMRDFRADAYLNRSETPYFSERQHSPASNGVFRADHSYLWPGNAGDRMSFVAVAPYAAVASTAISRDGSFTYTVPTDVASQPDLMFATADDVDCATDADGLHAPVPLTFRHLLTQVRFVFTDNDHNHFRGLQVLSVRLENVSARGTWNPAENAWGSLDAPTSTYEITYSPDSTHAGIGKYQYGGAGQEVWQEGYSMFLMPQTLPDDALLTVRTSHKTSSDYDETSENTYTLSLAGKQLLPGHIVTVEINSNYTFDVHVANADGTPFQLRALAPQAQELPLLLMWNGAGAGYTVLIDEACRGYARFNGRTGDEAYRSSQNQFTLCIDANLTTSDRFIKLHVFPGHKSNWDESDYLFAVKQRCGFTDDGEGGGLPDFEAPWGFDWTTPLQVEFVYDSPLSLYLEYDIVLPTGTAWISKGTSSIIYDYGELRRLARQPNSETDGLANVSAINNILTFRHPLDPLRYFSENTSADTEKVNGAEASIIDFIAAHSDWNISAVEEAMQSIYTIDQGGTNYFSGSNSNITLYLPAIAQLETLADMEPSPLVAGRTYWSSTVNASGEPVALQVSADGTHTRTTPGASTSCWVHPVRKH